MSIVETRVRGAALVIITGTWWAINARRKLELLSIKLEKTIDIVSKLALD
jgi:hypothetical protein